VLDRRLEANIDAEARCALEQEIEEALAAVDAHGARVARVGADLQRGRRRERDVRHDPEVAPRPEGAWPDNTYSTPQKKLYFNDEPVVIMHVPSNTDGNSVVHFRTADVISTGDVFTPDLIETYIAYKRENELDALVEEGIAAERMHDRRCQSQPPWILADLTARLLLTHLGFQSLEQLLAQHSVGLRILLLYSAHPGKEPVDTNFARSRNVVLERRDLVGHLLEAPLLATLRRPYLDAGTSREATGKFS
jgi:hypothetical protein